MSTDYDFAALDDWARSFAQTLVNRGRLWAIVPRLFGRDLELALLVRHHLAVLGVRAPIVSDVTNERPCVVVSYDSAKLQPLMETAAAASLMLVVGGLVGGPDQVPSWVDRQPADTTQDAIRLCLREIGDNPDRPGLLDTPSRVVRSWDELFAGYRMSEEEFAAKHLTCFDDIPAQQMITLSRIEMYSTCEHHMQPFVGEAHIAYIPKSKVVGISKLARVLEFFARRLQVQERIGEQVAEFLYKHLDAEGVAVVIDAKHFCMCARGVGKQHSMMRTSALRGAFSTDSSTRSEFMQGLPQIR